MLLKRIEELRTPAPICNKVSVHSKMFLSKAMPKQTSLKKERILLNASLMLRGQVNTMYEI